MESRLRAPQFASPCQDRVTVVVRARWHAGEVGLEVCMRSHNRLGSMLLVALLTISAAPVAVEAAPPSARATLNGSAPKWASAANYVGGVDTSAAVGFRVYLGWADAAGAEALARSVSDPASASYGKYVSAAQFRQRFAPAQSKVGAVQSWLRSQGFSVVYTPANNHYVAAEGTVAPAEAAFGTTFGTYKVNGKSVHAPSSNLSLPSGLTSTISGVVGLDDSAAFVTTNHVVDKDAPPSAGFRNAPPLSDYWAQLVSPYAYPAGFTDLSTPATAPWSVRGNTPAQIKGAYGISGYDGAGQTVAIIDAYASPTILADVNQWST